MVSREIFDKYYEIQQESSLNMHSPQVEWNTGISKEDHLDIIANYAEIFNRYKKNIVVLDDITYTIDAEYASKERCLIDGYIHIKDDIFIQPNTTSAAIVIGYV